MAETEKNTKKRSWYGARPGFLIAGAAALLGFGIISGVALDIATRPAKAPVVVRGPLPKPSAHVPPPKIEIQTDAFSPEQASIFAPGPAKPAQPQPQPQAKVTPPPAQQAAAVNAVPAPPSDGQAVIAIVIDDVGLDRARALKMINLKGPLTLSLMTYADGLPGLVDLARNGGHEIMAHLPMEPVSPKENPGKGALLVSMDDATIRRTLAADLDGWSGYVGINNHMGSKFTKDRQRMTVVMEELKSRGLLWLDSKTIGDSAGPAAAKSVGVPYLERDVFLDNVETVEAVTAQLEQLANTAKTRGSAIGIGHPHDATHAALTKWLPQLAQRGIVLVPVTEILKRRAAKSPE